MTPARSQRPPVTVVMPFAGTREQALAAVASLARLRVLPSDQLLLADNAGALAGGRDPEMPGNGGAVVTVVSAPGERSPAHARNAGAAAARDEAEWILFVDADTIAPADLLDRYFESPIDDDVGAVAGAIRPAPRAGGARAGLAARYAAHKNFLDAGAHLAHPFMPRAAAANLLVRRAAFDAVGGFFEGLRAAEDTDFCWRLQLAGWRLLGRPRAVVEHRYRDSVGALRRQWRAYAAGRAWLGRRYQGFRPRPALLRAAGRTMTAQTGGRPGATTPRTAPSRPSTTTAPPTRVAVAALDALLGVEELVGFTQANRPAGGGPAAGRPHRVVLADRFPAPGAAVEPGTRVEAAARPQRAEPLPADVAVIYREDDGLAERTAALARAALQSPRTVAAALADDPQATVALAPAALRLRAQPETTLAALDPSAADAVGRLARLAGRDGP